MVKDTGSSRKKASPAEINHVTKIIELASQLSPEERQELTASGFVMPDVRPKDDAVRFGYRCKTCNGIGLEFIGSAFVDHEGNEIATVPVTVSCESVPWQQSRLPSGKVNRRNPKCQCCGADIYLSRYRFIPRYVVMIEEYEAAKEDERKRINRLRGGLTADAIQRWNPADAGLKQPDGSEINLSDKPGAEGELPEGARPRDEVPVGEFPSDEKVSQLQDIDDKLGITEGFMRQVGR